MIVPKMVTVMVSLELANVFLGSLELTVPRHIVPTVATGTVCALKESVGARLGLLMVTVEEEVASIIA